MNKNMISIERKFRPEIEGLRIIAALFSSYLSHLVW